MQLTCIMERRGPAMFEFLIQIFAMTCEGRSVCYGYILQKLLPY
jgi:hypothetical protein